MREMLSFEQQGPSIWSSRASQQTHSPLFHKTFNLRIHLAVSFYKAQIKHLLSGEEIMMEAAVVGKLLCPNACARILKRILKKVSPKSLQKAKQGIGKYQERELENQDSPL